MPQIPWGEAEREQHRLIMDAYAPFLRLGPMNKLVGFRLKLPMEMPKLAENGAVEGTITLTSYRQYFDFLDEHKDEALRQFQIIHGEIEDN